MKVISQSCSKCVLAIMFCLVLICLLGFNAKTLLGAVSLEIRAIINIDEDSEILSPLQIESSLNKDFHNRLKFVELNGLSARLMGKKILNGVVKDENGQLNLMNDIDYVFDEKAEMDNVDRAIKILECAESVGANVLYVQRPWKNCDGQAKLPYNMELNYKDKYDFWCGQMRSRDIPILDLRNSSEGRIEFYNTDHHWTVGSSVYAAKSIVDELNHSYNLDLEKNNELLDQTNYNEKIYLNSFLGSEGIRTGKYYAGKDDFQVLWPKFNTDLTYTQYIEHERSSYREGRFYNVFIDETLLADENYNNKYAAYMYNGYIENRIKNNKADNNLKALLISDSFARTMAPYFSLCFSETRYLDPQEGRYTDSYSEYIQKYKPDVVVLMWDGHFLNI